MRLLLFILLFSFQANATVYYVSNTGSDAANGLTTGTAWQTIAKVNATSFSPGDQVLFKAGDTWQERLNVYNSGASGNVITYGAYSTGAKPLITGFEQVTGFTNVGNIWTASIPGSVADLNTVFVNGVLRAKARTPNSTYLTFSSINSKTQLSTSLTGTPDYTGHEIAVRTASWIIDVSKVSSQSGGTLNLTEDITYATSLGGDGFFFQNNVDDLDVVGEWVFDSTAKTLKVYATTSPTAYISEVDTLVHITADYITFDGLSFNGANKAAFQLDTANHVTITNCNINNSGTLAISGLKSSNCTISNDSIQNTLSGSVYLRQVDPYTPTVNTCDSALVDNNYIKNNGYLAGMGMSNNGRYMGIYIVGARTQITNNRVDSSGFNPIMFNGVNSLVYRNYVTNYCFTKDDGAGIDMVIGGYFPAQYNDGSVIRSNIVVNGIGAPDGSVWTSLASGIYLDDLTNNVTVDSNFVQDAQYGAIYLHDADSNTVTNNTAVIDNGSVFYYNGSNANISAGGNIIKRNIFYSENATTELIYRNAGTNLGNIDSNYYLRPSSGTNSFDLNGAAYSLSGWKTATGKDAASVGEPSGVTSTTPLVYYNPTLSDSTISLTGYYTDMKGGVYNNSVTLTPFTSAVLFPIATPPAPVRLNVKFRIVRNV